MASESFPVQAAPPAPVAAHVGNEQAQPIHSVLDNLQTDSDSVSLENANTAANIDNPEALREPAGTQPAFADNTLSGVAASEDQGSVEAAGAPSTEQKKEEPNQEAPKPTPKPNTGEKRDIDSATAPISEDRIRLSSRSQTNPRLKSKRLSLRLRLSPLKSPLRILPKLPMVPHLPRQPVIPMESRRRPHDRRRERSRKP